MNRVTRVAVAAGAALALWGAARMHDPLLAARREHHLNWEEPLENSPPLVSFTTVALGGFRGLIADVLWLRVTQLQEEKKYFEIVQLADWITKLEPRFALVWAFHAWNMAYNVSVMLDDPADRWRWLRHGIELLRDEGLFYNPGDAGLYYELSWLFQHKLGGFLDQAHPYYKRQWAEEMMALWGDTPRPEVTLALANPDDPRRRQMVEKYKLQPDTMMQVDAMFGPLDWRLPQAHAIYWAWRGKKYARGFDQVRLDRVIFQSMQDAFREGSLIYNRADGEFMPVPNLPLAARVRRAYELALAAYPEEDTIRNGYRNFLELAALVFYSNNRLSEAEELYRRRCDLVGERPPKEPLAEFAYRQLTDQMSRMSRAEAQAFVAGLCFQSYRWLALGEDDRAAGAQQLARLCWQRYQERYPGAELQERVGLPPLERLCGEALRLARESLRTEPALKRLESAQPPPAP